MTIDLNPRAVVQRRLAAVAFADVAGFSQLMAHDDLLTSRRWETLRNNVLFPLAESYEGRLVETAGDAVLLEFRSVVAALNWAVEVQHSDLSNTDQGVEVPLQLRIAVNVEDILPDGDNILGDGVNIASRIHAAAEPGQIVVTHIVRELVGNRAPVRFRDLGTPRLKNIQRVVHVFLAEPVNKDIASDEPLHHPFIEWTSRPTVAVLPFRSASAHEMEEYFGSGITEDIITGLSRSRAFHVIARGSTLRFAERNLDLHKIAEQLGVNYILDGSVRRQGDKLRITAELVDIARNRSVWAERFDGDAEDLFDFQDEIVASLVGSFEPRLREAGIERIRNRSTESLDAYDCVLKAASQLYLFSDDSFAKSGIALDRALELDPSYAQAHAYSAWRLNFLYGEEQSVDPERDKQLALEHARRAIALEPADAFCQVVAAHLTSLTGGDPEGAISMFDLALSLDQNNALGWAMSGVTLSYLSRGEESMQRFRNAFKLSPFDAMNFSWWCGAGMAEFVSGNYDKASDWLRRAKQANPRYAATLRMLAASLALEGKTDEARAVARALVGLHKDFSVDRLISWYPMVRREDREALRKGLLLADLPR